MEQHMTRRNLAAGLSVLTAVALCSLASPGGSAFAEESEPDDTQTPNAIPWDVAPHIDEQTVPSPDAPDGEWQAAVNAAIDEIREEWPDDFGYGAILEPGAAEVRFAGAVPPSLPAVEGLAYVSDLGYTEIQAHELDRKSVV